MGLLGSGPGSRCNSHCLWGLWFLSCNWGTETNPLLVKSPLSELHTHTQTQHDYIWLNALGNQDRKWPVFFRESGVPEKLSLWGLLGQQSTRSARTWQRGMEGCLELLSALSSAPDWHTQERQMLSMLNSGTEHKAQSYTAAIISEYRQNYSSLKEIHE